MKPPAETLVVAIDAWVSSLLRRGLCLGRGLSLQIETLTRLQGSRAPSAQHQHPENTKDQPASGNRPSQIAWRGRSWVELRNENPGHQQGGNDGNHRVQQHLEV